MLTSVTASCAFQNGTVGWPLRPITVSCMVDTIPIPDVVVELALYPLLVNATTGERHCDVRPGKSNVDVTGLTSVVTNTAGVAHFVDITPLESETGA